MKSFLANLRKTIQDKALIRDGDRVAVGVSAGKDSMALLYGLKTLQSYMPIKYDLEAVTISMGFDDFDLTATRTYIEDQLGIPYTICPTDIYKIVFEVRKESNPCSLCANMRRGALAGVMKERNLNVLALGHHNDDAIVTFFMNMLYSGRLNTHQYSAHLSKSDIHMIRPMLNIPEKQIIELIRKEGIPTVKSPCPADQNTKREEIKNFTHELFKMHKDCRQNILTAMENKDQLELWFDK